MRFVRALISIGFVLFGVAVLLLAVGAYLTASGRSVPVMRTVAGVVGELTAGQKTEQLTVSVSVDPASSRLGGVARLIVRATESRRHIYLLLNDGLSVERVSRAAADGGGTPLAHYRLWLMTVIDLGAPLAAGEQATLDLEYGGDPLSGLSPFGQGVIAPDEVILTPSDLWYPTDWRSSFTADVEVTLPASLRPVHAGASEVVVDLGSSRRTRWTTARPVPGVALVAGRYGEHGSEETGVVFRVNLAPQVDLDAAEILRSMTAATATSTASYGPTAASRHVLFVSPRLARTFADGSGVYGLPPRAFTAGDYGFAAIADALARSWWGAAVSADPTRPRDGGGWVIEGFAANAARGAVREHFGADAEFRWRAERSFDPTAAGLLAEASVLDEELADEGKVDAEALRHKAAYVAAMLEERVGRDVYLASARKILERGGAVTSRQVRETFAETGAAGLDEFFAQWVDSVGQVDLSLDPLQGGARLANHQTAAVAGPVELWRVPPGGSPSQQTMVVGDTTPVGNAERLVVDPRGTLADMYRSNNVLPREEAPRSLSHSARGQWLVVDGEPHDWAPARVRIIDAAGDTRHSWSFDLGLSGAPRWSADGTHVLAVEPPRGGAAKLYALHPSDGSMIEVGHDTVVHGGAEGYAAARADRLVWVVDERARTLVDVDGGRVGDPLISPDGAYVAFAVHRGAEMELRLRGTAAATDRILMTWRSGQMLWRWSPDTSRLFAVLAGDWDWQLWEIPLDGVPRALMREAAGVRDLAVAEDGNRVALVASPQLDYRGERYEVFLIDRTDPARAQQFSVGGMSAVDLTWRDGDSLLVIVSDPTYSVTPPRRDIKTLRLSDGSVLPFP